MEVSDGREVNVSQDSTEPGCNLSFGNQSGHVAQLVATLEQTAEGDREVKELYTRKNKQCLFSLALQP